MAAAEARELAAAARAEEDERGTTAALDREFTVTESEKAPTVTTRSLSAAALKVWLYQLWLCQC